MNDSTVLHGEGTTMKSKSESGVVVVVSVGAGLGAALARRVAAGYKVALIAGTATVTEPVADEIRAAGGIAVPIQSDATIAAKIAATHEQIRHELGPIEILIYSGGRRPNPQGVHVAYINVDGGIDMPLLRRFRPEAKDEELLKPSAIADAFWYLAHQDPSAWTHELDVRPFTEKF